jgi:hypothetical protein
VSEPAAEPASRADPTWTDLRVAGVAVLVLAAVGAVLGVVWSAWSGPQQRAYVIAPGALYPYDEVETMAAADGRYLVLVASAGFVAALVLWFGRAANRGPTVATGLAAGGLAGAALTWWVGHLTGGGTYAGKAQQTIPHLPLTLHLRGLLLVQPALACLVYGVLAAFAARDDLGHPDHGHPDHPGHPDHGGHPEDNAHPDDPAAAFAAARSVQAGGQPQDGRGHGDAPGALQQGDLPSQQPGEPG